MIVRTTLVMVAWVEAALILWRLTKNYCPFIQTCNAFPAQNRYFTFTKQLPVFTYCRPAVPDGGPVFGRSCNEFEEQMTSIFQP